MEITRNDKNEYTLKHGDTNLKIFAQGDSVYMHDENTNRFFGRINGSVGAIAKYD